MNKLLVLSSLILYSQFGTCQVEEIKNETSWGKLENNQKVGNWQYFDEPEKPSLMVNHSTGKITFFKKDTSKYLIKKDGEWILSNVVSPPHYLGSNKEFDTIMSANLSFPLEARRNSIEGQTAI